MATSSTETAVLVVGAGPVGLMLACELARRDVPVRIVDRLTEPTDQSRAIVVHARTLEALERLGVAQAVIDAGVRTTGMLLRAGGDVLATIELSTVESPFPFSVSLPQTETERILADRLASLGVRVERGVALGALEQDADGARATLAGPDGGEEVVSCRYVAGCDGARSTVRASCGDRLAGSFHGEVFALGDVEGEHDLDPANIHSFFSERGPLLVFPMRGGRMRVMAQLGATRDPAGGESPPEQLSAPTLEDLQRLCEERGDGLQLRLTRAHWLTTFEIHHALVSSYRHGRAFLLGDAAHIHSPAGGQGMNTGLQDAFNLGWKLAAAWRETAGEPLLDSFDAERRPVAERVLSSTTKLTRLGTLETPWARALRDRAIRVGAGLAPVQHALARQTEETDIAYRASPVVAGRGLHDGPRPGDAAPDVADIGLRAALLAAPPDAHVALCIAGHRAAAPVRPTDGAPLWRVAVGAADAAAGFDAVVDDPGGRAAERYATGRRGGLLLVRPDGYVGLVAEATDQGAVDRYFAGLR
ncbi:MAG TPA: FAD-dependent monooxygenase [Capillimicrobium sp.]|jgi:2-polyprenyl-6-methoxyphenol hydroxylase-like FAD-dependent oxidoreductase